MRQATSAELRRLNKKAILAGGRALADRVFDDLGHRLAVVWDCGLSALGPTLDHCRCWVMFDKEQPPVMLDMLTADLEKLKRIPTSAGVKA